MKKGDAYNFIMVLGGVIILMIVVAVTWGFVLGEGFVKPKVTQETQEVKEAKPCSDDRDCISNSNGAKCRGFYDPNFPERSSKFCGCEKNEDCQSTPEVTRSGICGQTNTCR